MATYWREDMALDPNLEWTVTLEQKGRGQSYVARADGKEIIMDRVTSILDEALGKGEALINWGSRQTLLDVMARFMGGGSGDDDRHIENLKLLDLELQAIFKNAGGVTKSGRKYWGSKWTFQQLAYASGLRYPQVSVPQDFCWAVLADWMEQACNKARFRKLDTAGQIGTRAHELIERWITGGGDFSRIGEDGREYTIHLEDEAPEVQRAVEAFWAWWDMANLQMVACEVSMIDVKRGLAGTADAFFQDENGDLVLFDYKTSKSVYEQYLLQVTAYGDLAEGTKGLGWPKRAYILRFDKNTGEFECLQVWGDRIEYLDLRQMWYRALRMARWRSEACRRLEAWRKSL